LPEAATGFDTLTNGRVPQTQHDADRTQFEEDAVLPALGPVYNARSCANCHETPVTGGSSQVTEVRTATGLVHDRAVRAEFQEHLVPGIDFTLRASTSLLGLGLVEDIADDELRTLARANGGQVVEVEVLETPGSRRVGRFGWKCQHASLLSFAGDAEFGEKGVTNRLFTGGQQPPFEDVDEDGSEDIDALRTLHASDQGTQPVGGCELGPGPRRRARLPDHRLWLLSRGDPVHGEGGLSSLRRLPPS
jgi:hypothetical protein